MGIKHRARTRVRGRRPKRYTSLVVAFDSTTRSFVADAWYSFCPRLEVFTAPSSESAIAWCRSVNPEILVIAKSVDGDAFRDVLRATEGPETNLSCLILEARADWTSTIRDTRLGLPVIEMRTALDLSEILDVARRAVSILDDKVGGGLGIAVSER